MRVLDGGIKSYLVRYCCVLKTRGAATVVLGIDGLNGISQQQTRRSPSESEFWSC